MSKKKYYFFHVNFVILAWILFCQVADGQSNVKRDSLLSLWHSPTLTVKDKALLCSELADYYKDVMLDSAFRYAKLGQELSRSIKFNSGVIQNSIKLGAFYIRTDNLEEAEKEFLGVLKLAETTDSDHDLLKLYMYLGYLNDVKSVYERSMFYYFKGLQIAEINNDSLWISDYYNNMAIIYQIVGEPRKSIQYNLQCVRLFKKYNETVNYANCLINLGSAYVTADLPDSAAFFLEMALPIQKELNNYDALVNLYLAFDDLAFLKADYKTSQQYISLALKAYDSVDGTFTGSKSFMMSEIQTRLGRNLLNLGFPRQAIETFYSAMQVTGKESMNLFRVMCAENLSLAYGKLGLTDSAFAWFRIFKSLDDTLKSNLNQDKIQILEIKFAYEKEKQLEKLREIRVAKEHKIKELWYLSGILGLVVISLAILFFFFLKQKEAALERLRQKSLVDEKEKLEHEFEYKSKELTSSLMLMLRRNELLMKITSEIKDASRDLDENKQHLFFKIIRDIEADTSKRTNRDFEVRFKDANTKFYTQLSERFSNLTPNELKLCAFLKLNMSTKEIASITFQSEHAIKISRYRLRKKLNLAENESLVNFLMKIPL